MNPHELSQKCVDKRTGKVDTTAMLFAYKFFSAWRPIDYSELDKFIYNEKLKHEKQKKQTLKKDAIANIGAGMDHHISLKGAAMGVMAAKRMVGGAKPSRAATLLRNDPSKKDLKALVNAVRDSFYAGYGIYEEAENESDEEEVEIHLMTVQVGLIRRLNCAKGLCGSTADKEKQIKIRLLFKFFTGDLWRQKHCIWKN